MTMLESLTAATDTIWTEAAIVLGLICSVLAFIAFIGTGWAIPIDDDEDPEFDGLGLWHRCGKSDDGTVCVNFMGKVDLPGEAEWNISTKTNLLMDTS